MPLWKKKKAAEPAAPLDVLRWKIVAVNILFAAMVVATLCFVAARQGKNALEEKHRLAFASLCSALEQPILAHRPFCPSTLCRASSSIGSLRVSSGAASSPCR